MKRRRRVSDQVDPQSEKWARDKVTEHNKDEERISVEMLVDIASQERDKIFHEDFKNYDPHFPPGKDKLQHVVNVWITKGVATRNQADGIILRKSKILTLVPNRFRLDLFSLTDAARKLLLDGTQWQKADFIRHYALRRSLAALPTEYWISSRAVHAIKRTTFDLLVEHVNVWGIERLDLLRKQQQKKFWELPDFKKLAGWAERIVSGAGSDYDRLQADKDMGMLLKLLKNVKRGKQRKKTKR